MHIPHSSKKPTQSSTSSHIPSESSSSHGGSDPLQSKLPKDTSIALPDGSEIAPVPKSKHISFEKFPFKLVKIPLLPAGITLPVNEKPRTVFPPTDTVNPELAAKPPDALVKLEPIMSN